MKQRLYAIMLVACLSAMAARADDKPISCEYWIDRLSGNTVSVTSDNGAFQFVVDASALSEGVHSLYYRAVDGTGSSSALYSWVFFHAKRQSFDDCVLEYWIDESPHSTQEIDGTGQALFSVDASALREGVHTFYYRTIDGTGASSVLHSWVFFHYKRQSSGDCVLEYWIDGSTHATQEIDDTGQALFTVDASALSEGVHTFYYRSIDGTGTASVLHSWVFFHYKRQPSGDCVLEYWIDESDHQTQQLGSDGEAVFSADASTLPEGIHTFYYQVRSSLDIIGTQGTWLFYRTSPKLEGTKVNSYRIWWNEHENEAIEVQVPDGPTEFLYEDVLAVPEYARNDGYSRDNTARFHIVFADDRGNLSPIETAVVGYPDVYPPVTTVEARTTADGIAISWTSNEDGVRDWNVYYSENGEPYLLWKANTTRQQATFSGQRGSTYKFLVTARDNSGNYEAMEESKAVTITIK